MCVFCSIAQTDAHVVRWRNPQAVVTAGALVSDWREMCHVTPYIILIKLLFSGSLAEYAPSSVSHDRFGIVVVFIAALLVVLWASCSRREEQHSIWRLFRCRSSGYIRFPSLPRELRIDLYIFVIIIQRLTRHVSVIRLTNRRRDLCLVSQIHHFNKLDLTEPSILADRDRQKRRLVLYIWLCR